MTDYTTILVEQRGAVRGDRDAIASQFAFEFADASRKLPGCELRLP